LHFVTAVNSVDLKTSLLALATTLDNSLKDAIAKLTAEGIPSEVAVLKDLETKLEKSSTDLKAATDPNVLKQLEAGLTQLERTIQLELLKINKAGPAFNKNDLLSKVDSLVKNTNDAIELWTTAGNAAEANVLRQDLGALQTLANQLKVATDITIIRRLEAQLNQMEAKLAAELKKIGGFLV
jgi:stalled ribosome rescue protein Dom34